MSSTTIPAGDTPARKAHHAPSTLPRLLASRVVQAALGVSHQTLYNLVERGELPPPVKIGAASRWDESEILAYIESRKAAREARS